jgi:hypothetical protein
LNYPLDTFQSFDTIYTIGKQEYMIEPFILYYIESLDCIHKRIRGRINKEESGLEKTILESMNRFKERHEEKSQDKYFYAGLAAIAKDDD